jgi:hypothetical protein
VQSFIEVIGESIALKASIALLARDYGVVSSIYLLKVVLKTTRVVLLYKANYSSKKL